jgi:hypothetical protein
MYGKLEKRGLVVSNATLDKRLKESVSLYSHTHAPDFHSRMEERIVERSVSLYKLYSYIYVTDFHSRMEERLKCLDGLDERSVSLYKLYSYKYLCN